MSTIWNNIIHTINTYYIHMLDLIYYNAKFNPNACSKVAYRSGAGLRNQEIDFMLQFYCICPNRSAVRKCKAWVRV